MAHINEPVEEWNIIITELVHGNGDEPRKVFNTFTMKTVAELRAYFLGKYSVAKSLGYHFPEPAKTTYNKNVIGRLEFEYRDRMVYVKWEFNGVADFVYCLENHPALAKVVEYVPKPKRIKRF